MQFSNYNQHPTNSNYVVFTYFKKDMSDYFMKLLTEKGISFEYEEDLESNTIKHYIGVKKSDEKAAVKLNFLAYGKFRKPFIKSKIGKTVLIVFFLSLLSIALVGFFKSY